MEEQLYQACEDGKVEEVKKLLQNEQININWQNQNNYPYGTPFYIACQNGHIDIVKLLLNDIRVDADNTNNNGWTPFHIACGNGNIEIVKLLLNDNRIDINQANEYGVTPFYCACYNGHLEIVKLLLNDQRIDINKANNDGWTPLYVACNNGHTEIVKLLLNDQRVEINRADNDGWTPLYVACLQGHIEIVKILLDDGNINQIEIRYDRTPFYVACENGLIEIVKLLLNDQKVDINQIKNEGVAPFFIACQNGHIDIVKLLLNDQRVEINRADDTGWTPLSIACLQGHIEIVKLLINDNRVDINKANESGQTPFYCACYNGHLEIVKLLLNDERVDINKANNDNGWTPLHIACSNGHVEIVKLFLSDNRVDLNQADNDGWTPFYVACCYGKTEMVKYLLESEREIEINKKDNKHGKTGLDYAKEKANTDIVDLIESFQRNPNETRTKLKKELVIYDMQIQFWNDCKNGKVEEVRKLLQNSQININWQHYNNSITPFNIACHNGHIEIVKLLLNDKKVDITKVDNDGWTPVFIACCNGHIGIVKLLLNDKRIDINETNDDGSTPFLIACCYGKTEVVKYLLESGREIDINKTNKYGQTGLDFAKGKGNTDIVKLIESFQKRIEDEKKYNKIQNEKEEKRKETENLEEQRKKFENFEEWKREFEEKLNKNEEKHDRSSIRYPVEDPDFEFPSRGRNSLFNEEEAKQLEEDEKELEEYEKERKERNRQFDELRNGMREKMIEAAKKGVIKSEENGESEEEMVMEEIRKGTEEYRRISTEKLGRPLKGYEDSMIEVFQKGFEEEMRESYQEKREKRNQEEREKRIQEERVKRIQEEIKNLEEESELRKLFPLYNIKPLTLKDLENPDEEQHGTGIGDNTGLWNDEIMKIMEPLKKKGFKGVYSIDQIKQIPFNKGDKIKLEEEKKKVEEEKKKEETKRKKIEEEKIRKETERKLEEEKRKKEESEKSNYEIEHNGKLYKLKTSARTLSELENDVRSKIKFQKNGELVLEFNENGNFFILDDMDDLEEGMRIKVSISTSNLTITDSTNVNNECWWNTKPNDKTKWEEKGFIETKYIRCLLRDNKQNVVGNENEYLKKLEILMTFFGGDVKQINKAYVLFNEKLFNSFQNHRSFLFNQQRVNSKKFKKDDWKNGNESEQKRKFHDHYIKMAETFDWNHSKSLHAIPMIHGTSGDALQEICQTGLAPTGETDAGFYGQGIYFSSSLSYTANYTPDILDGKPFIICMITPGNVYPVTESPYISRGGEIKNPDGLLGSACKFGYQSHYTLVDKRKYEDAYPITGNIDEKVIANELVVFDKAQVLPLFAIYVK